MLDQGYQSIPTQWIEVDKNDAIRTPSGPYVPPKYKSRLVGRGDLDSIDVRSDSPTAEIEAQNLVCSFAAAKRLTICSADITNAYFQGERLDRIMLLSQPDGGLPGVDPDAQMLARVPIYGTKDAGRGFWKRLRSVCLEAGLHENRIMKSVYSFQKDGKVVCMMVTHVDDLLWACEPEYQYMIDHILKTFECGKIEKGNFRYCGKDRTGQ